MHPIFNQLNIGVIVIGVDQKIRFINNRALQWFGHQGFNLVGKLYSQVVHPLVKSDRIRNLHRLPLIQVLNTGQDAQFEVDIQNHGGQLFHFQVFSSVIRNDAGGVVGGMEIYLPSRSKTNQDGLQGRTAEYMQKFVSSAALEHIKVAAKQSKDTVALKRYRSIAFVDIVGFTTFSEKLNPHEVVQILNIFFRKINGTILRYQGDIDKFLGDAILLTFINAEASVRAVTDIVLIDLPIINAQIQSIFPQMTDIEVHAGVNTGWVILGELGSPLRKDFTVIGDEVNLASRIQSLSPPNEIWISGKTAGNLGKMRNLFEMGEYVNVKGKKNKVTTYKFVPRNLPVSNKVMLFEQQQKIQQTILAKLKNLGVKQVTAVENTNQLQEKLDLDYDTMVVGPSASNADLSTIQNIAKKAGYTRDIMIPVSDNVTPESLAKLEKLGIRTYIPHSEGEALQESLGNAMRQQKVEVIKSATKVGQEEDEETVHKVRKSGLDIKKLGIEEGVGFNLSKDSIVVQLEKRLDEKGMITLRDNILKVWEFEYEKRINLELVLDFDAMHLGDVSDESILSVVESIKNDSRFDDTPWFAKKIVIHTREKILKGLFEKVESDLELEDRFQESQG